MTAPVSSTIVQRLWNYCNVLREEWRLLVMGNIESAAEAVGVDVSV